MNKHNILLGAIFLLVAACNSNQSTPTAKAPVGKVGSTTLRVNFLGDLQQRPLRWKVDGTPVGQNARAAVGLARTQHKLGVTLDNKKAEFNLDATSDMPLFVELEEKDGRIKSIFQNEKAPKNNLYIFSEPSGASVFINRRAFGNTPVAVGLFSGDQEVEVILTRPNYRLAKQQVTIKDGQVNQVTITMEQMEDGESAMDSALPKPVTTLSIDSPDSPGTKILLNGIDIKRVTPQEKLELPIGLYQVTLVRADGTSFNFRTELEEGKTAVVKENLQGREAPTGPQPGVLVPSYKTESPIDGEAEHGHHHHH